MRVKEGLLLKEIAGNYIIVPVSGSLVNLNAMINVNEVGAFIFRCLEKETTEAEILSAMKKEYDADESVMKNDLLEFLSELRKNSMLQE